MYVHSSTWHVSTSWYVVEAMPRHSTRIPTARIREEKRREEKRREEKRREEKRREEKKSFFVSRSGFSLCFSHFFFSAMVNSFALYVAIDSKSKCLIFAERYICN